MTPEQIKSIRISLGRTQEEMAKIVEAPTNTYARWERGDCKPIPIYRKKLETLFEFTEKRNKSLELGILE